MSKLSTKCRHDYRLYNNQPGEWKLIWECRKCGLLCICKCFKNAMDSMTDAPGRLDFPIGHDISWLASEKGVSVSEMERKLEGIDYCGMACDLCLDKPSTHLYSGDIHDTEFQRRYGAYILRDAIVMAAVDEDGKTVVELLSKAEEGLRELYGFRPKGECAVDNDKLHEIVKGLFPEEVVLRSHSPEWLPNDVLEIFIPAFNLAIEHRGTEHYEPTEGVEPESLASTMKMDEERERACSDNGVSLIIMPYFVPVDRDTVGWKIAEVRSRG